MRSALFLGRWQPFHLGHRWLIDQKLKKGIPCIVAIRDMPPDKNNPLCTDDVYRMLRHVFENESVKIIIIPDIESVNYGRGVGYEINEYIPPSNIKAISGTEVRDKIRSGDNSWKNMVDPKALDWLEEHYEKDKT